MKRFIKRWEISYNQHKIVVENWWDFSLRGGEKLTIDGKIVAQHEGWLGFSSDLEAFLHSSGKEYKIRAHLGSIDYGFGIGCKIFIDNELVGGDIHKKFIT